MENIFDPHLVFHDPYCGLDPMVMNHYFVQQGPHTSHP